MIRTATFDDIPALVGMTAKLHAAASIALPMDAGVTAKFLRLLIGSPLGFVLVAGEPVSGFIAASVTVASISSLPVAAEHGWWSEGGQGRALLARYEAWAREMGCFAARMSTPPGVHRVERILDRSGFVPAEQAWIKVL